MTDVLGVTGMEPEAFRSVLKFVYFGNVDITPLLACDCAPFAKRFEAFELQKISESIIAHNISGNNVLPILKVAYLPENMDRPEMASLRAHCLMFLTQNVAGMFFFFFFFNYLFILFLFFVLLLLLFFLIFFFFVCFYLSSFFFLGVNLDPLMELDIRISVDILRAWQKTVM